MLPLPPAFESTEDGDLRWPSITPSLGARCRTAIPLSQVAIEFQLALFWSTTSKLLISNA